MYETISEFGQDIYFTGLLPLLVTYQSEIEILENDPEEFVRLTDDLTEH
jgi:hypothetical protein